MLYGLGWVVGGIGLYAAVGYLEIYLGDKNEF